jgi:hypothetical protein
MKQLPIGIDDFKELIQNDYHFVDKSLFIKDVIADGSKVILITRPRRFGKTINMSMLDYYFTNNSDQKLNLFANLEINKHKELTSKHYHKYPTIFITFKDIKADNYDAAIGMFKFTMSKLYEQFKSQELLDILSVAELEYFERIVDNKVSDITELKTSLTKLIDYLYNLYNKEVIVLIDEYDTPIHAAYSNDYYDDFIEVFKTFLGIALKGNKQLHKAVITGITRVAQASIFSELNHFEVYSVLREDYGQYFGFAEDEVVKLLKKLTINGDLDEIRTWYNGYKIGQYTLYNPWSILNYLKQKGEFAPYWLNTSDNRIIKSLINKSKPVIKSALLDLLQGKTIEQPLQENLVFQNLEKSEEAIWALLLYSGYLTIESKKREGRRLIAGLFIPNKEVMHIYDEIVERWFGNALSLEEYDKFIKSLIKGDLKTFGKVLSDYITESGSYFDFNANTKEQVFHCLILGLVLGLRENYVIKSNQEAGYGRFDVALIPKDKDKTGILIELKTADKESELDAMAKTALEQINDKKYTLIFKDHSVEKILLIGIAFWGKKLKLYSSNDKLEGL